jgi:hypothetical protein
MTPNACHSKPRPSADRMLIVQDGYFAPPANRAEAFTRVPRYVEVPFRMTVACVAGPNMVDPRCGAFPELGLAPCPHLASS